MLTACLVIETRCLRTPDGKVWVEGAFSYDFLRRYLAAGDHVRVVARVKDVPEVSPNLKRADGEGVSFAAVPYYVGPLAFIKRAGAVRQAIQQAVQPDDAVILRIPSTLANLLMPVLRQRRQPYAVEVIGDPLDVYSAGAVRHPLRPFFRWWFYNQQVRQCAGAAAASYVTQDALQRRYPCPNYSIGVSDADLPEQAFVAAPRPRQPEPRSPFRIITVGSLEHLYKGTDVLINALAACNSNGMELELSVAGNGRYRLELEDLAARSGQAERVIFHGHLPAGDAVRAKLDSADLFILPSRCEGLPKALLEAMARGLPCIGSRVGGIPELLDKEDIVPPGDAAQLAAKICEVLGAPDRMEQMSRRNLQIARTYSADILGRKRQEFYRHIRTFTPEAGAVHSETI